jgi:hypothetical protein
MVGKTIYITLKFFYNVNFRDRILLYKSIHSYDLEFNGKMGMKMISQRMML